MSRQGLGKSVGMMRLRAAAVSLYRRVPLPPGDSALALDDLEQADRQALIRKARHEGRVFRGRAWGESWIYVVGLAQSRQILQEHGELLQPVTIDVRSLFPEGLLRQMQGDTHRRYRDALLKALKSSAASQGAIGTFCARRLARLAEMPEADRMDAAAFRDLLSEIVFEELSASVLGVLPDAPLFVALSHEFKELGGNGLVWNVGARQQRAHRRIETLLADAPSDGASILATLRDADEINQTMLGNLIYMVEMGRYDVAAFFRWLTWFAAHQPDALERIAAEDDARRPLATAFVQETLRLEQSERLVRRVTRDFVAGGFLFPRDTRVRFCLWESHKLPEAFDDPFTFEPERFVHDRPGRDRFAPFGLDVHQCPFASHSIALGAAWVAALARNFWLRRPDGGHPVRGLYHWEPPEAFSPDLEPRRKAGECREGRDAAN